MPSEKCSLQYSKRGRPFPSGRGGGAREATGVPGPAWPTGDAELRICRRGATLVLLQRAIGQDAWSTAASYHRPDLPAEIQVGPVVYAAAASPDLRVSFDEVVFEEVSEPAECTGG